VIGPGDAAEVQASANNGVGPMTVGDCGLCVPPSLSPRLRLRPSVLIKTEAFVSTLCAPLRLPTSAAFQLVFFVPPLSWNLSSHTIYAPYHYTRFYRFPNNNRQNGEARRLVISFATLHIVPAIYTRFCATICKYSCNRHLHLRLVRDS
jgi:hypothetical protein